MKRAVFAAVLSLAGVTDTGCVVEEHGVPQGKLAVVGETVFGAEDLASVGSQLGAYARLRFAGPEGQATLLRSLVAAELMAQEAREAGAAEDARVAFALAEETATVHLSAELERLVPTADVAADEDALVAYYDQHLSEYTDPEKRSIQGVVFRDSDEAEAALAKLEAGDAALADFGEVFATPLQARDDGEFPAFHRHLFAPDVGLGDFVPVPVYLGQSLFVGRVQRIVPATARPAEDPAVRESLVQAVRAPLVVAAKRALLAELSANFAPPGDRDASPQ